MIITLAPIKDTYVTNLSTQFNSGSLANVGHAATIDLFKLYNENKNAYSWIAFTFNASTAFVDGHTFTLVDSHGTSKTFEIDNNNSITAGNIRVDINGQSIANYSSIIAAAINGVDTLKITASFNTSNELVLKQDKSGKSGDTNITFTGTANTTMVSKSSRNSFERIEFSTGLLKFDLSQVKSEYVSTFANSIFNQNKTKFKAKLVLKDVNTGNNKPKNYQLDVTPLLKDFDEGIGKDTIHFSDTDYSNFVNMSNSNLWSIKEYISKGTGLDIDGTSNNSNIDDIGNKDIEFDVTDYVKNLLNAGTDYGLLVKFTDTYLYNQVSYFVKRFGSRHLLDKTFIPELKLILEDSFYKIPENAQSKIRYLDNEEKFYLYNLVNGSLKNFNLPSANDIIKFKIGNLFDEAADPGNITNFRGENLVGIKKKTLTATDISRFNSNISSVLLSKGFYKDTITWYWEDSDSTVVEAGSFVVGKKYKIRNYAAGQNDFTLIGAANNNVGTVFTATGAGSGLGDAFEVIDYNLLTEDVTFYAGETTKDINFRSLNVSIRVEDNALIAKNGIQTLEVFFIDRLKQYDAVKVPYDIASENLGNVYYKVIDSDTNKVLIDYEIKNTTAGSEHPGGTLMFFDGEKYIFDLYIPASYKQKRIHFEFLQYDNINKLKKYIKSNDLIFRIK